MFTKTEKARIQAAKAVWADYRALHGFARKFPALLSPPETNMKLDRTESVVYGLSLAQSRTSGYNTCPWSTPNCVTACVAKNGNGKYEGVQKARIVKTRFFFEHREIFLTLLSAEIRKAVAKHNGCAFRLNTFSDIDWQTVAPDLFVIEGATFYDYTKDLSRVAKFPNVHFTYSATERTKALDAYSLLKAGENVAVVIDVKGGRIRGTEDYRPIPSTLFGIPTIDGDADDNRGKDAKGRPVVLRAKGHNMPKLAMARNFADLEAELSEALTHA